MNFGLVMLAFGERSSLWLVTWLLLAILLRVSVGLHGYSGARTGAARRPMYEANHRLCRTRRQSGCPRVWFWCAAITPSGLQVNTRHQALATTRPSGTGWKSHCILPCSSGARARSPRSRRLGALRCPAACREAKSHAHRQSPRVPPIRSTLRHELYCLHPRYVRPQGSRGLLPRTANALGGCSGTRYVLDTAQQNCTSTHCSGPRPVAVSYTTPHFIKRVHAWQKC